MLRIGICGIMLLGCFRLDAMPDTTLARQCSVIREIVFQASPNHFSPLIDQPLRSSQGYQVNGRWTFSHERFSSAVSWMGAESCFIEHATDQRDTTATESWQFIVNFPALPAEDQGLQALKRMVGQINTCMLPLNDSVTIQLGPVDPEELPPTMPDMLKAAYLFNLPVLRQEAELNLMAGLEKTRQGYRPVLMVECLEVRKSLLQ